MWTEGLCDPRPRLPSRDKSEHESRLGRNPGAELVRCPAETAQLGGCPHLLVAAREPDRFARVRDALWTVPPPVTRLRPAMPACFYDPRRSPSHTNRAPRPGCGDRRSGAAEAARVPLPSHSRYSLQCHPEMAAVPEWHQPVQRGGGLVLRSARPPTLGSIRPPDAAIPR